MNLFKKSICFSIVLMLILGMVGCGTSQDRKDDAVVELTWFVPISEQPDGDLVLEKVSEITKEKIGATLNLQFVDIAAYTERMTMNMASGNSFDLCFTGYLNPYLQGVDNGGYMGIGALLKEHAPKLLESLPEYVWEIATVNGEIYAVPNLQGFAPPNSLYLYKDLTEKYNFDTSTIKTVEDVEPFLATIKENEPELIPYRMNYGVNMWTGDIYEEITSGLVIRCDGSSPEVLLLYDTPEYKHAISILHDWFQKGYIRSDLLSAGSDIQDFNAGKYAVNQSGYLPGAEATAKQTTNRDVIIVPVTKPYLSKSKSMAAMTAVGLNSKNPEKAVQLLELVNTDKSVLNLLALGIKDKHYKLNNEGKFEIISGSGYQTAGGWLFGNQFNQILAAGQNDDVWEETAKLNLDAVRSPILGFVLDTESIKNEISQVATVVSEFSGNIHIVNNYSDYDQFMQKLKDAGIDKLKEEVQKQINAYWEEIN